MGTRNTNRSLNNMGIVKNELRTYSSEEVDGIPISRYLNWQQKKVIDFVANHPEYLDGVFGPIVGKTIVNEEELLVRETENNGDRFVTLQQKNQVEPRIMDAEDPLSAQDSAKAFIKEISDTFAEEIATEPEPKAAVEEDDVYFEEGADLQKFEEFFKDVKPMATHRDANLHFSALDITGEQFAEAYKKSLLWGDGDGAEDDLEGVAMALEKNAKKYNVMLDVVNDGEVVLTKPALLYSSKKLGKQAFATFKAQMGTIFPDCEAELDKESGFGFVNLQRNENGYHEGNEQQEAADLEEQNELLNSLNGLMSGLVGAMNGYAGSDPKNDPNFQKQILPTIEKAGADLEGIMKNKLDRLEGKTANKQYTPEELDKLRQQSHENNQKADKTAVEGLTSMLKMNLRGLEAEKEKKAETEKKQTKKATKKPSAKKKTDK